MKRQVADPYRETDVIDTRAPRFANMVGAGVLGAASIFHAAGLTTVGWALGLLVAALALLAAFTGLCAGCEMYKLGARLRGIRAHLLDRIDLSEIGVDHGGEIVVQFTHPLCTDCRTLEQRLRDAGHRVVTVDVSRRPELARKYGIAVVPVAVAVAVGGTVTTRLAG